MSNLDNKIREKYQAEYKDDFQQDDWKDFEAFRQKKKRRKPLLLIFPLLVIFVCAWFIFPHIIGSYAIDNPIAVSKAADKFNSTTSGDRSTSGTEIYDKDKIVEQSHDLNDDNLDENKNSRNILRIKTNGKQVKKIVLSKPKEIYKQLEKAEKSSRIRSLTAVDSSLPSDKEASTKQMQNNSGELSTAGNARRAEYYDRTGLATSINPIEQNKAIFLDAVLNTEKIFLLKSQDRFKFVPKVSTGYSLNNQMAVYDDIASFYSIAVGIENSERIRYKLDFHVQEISYKSYEIDPTIGIRSVEGPGENSEFKLAEAETNSLYAGIGIDYLTFTQNGFSHFVGISYGLHTILHKEIDYEFLDEDDQEVIVNLTNEDRRFRWNTSKFCTGLEYDHRRARIFVELAYIHEFNRSTKILPSLFHGSIGLAYKL